MNHPAALIPPGRLAFVDLDDTLLGPDKTISLGNLAALDALRSAGVQVVIASGRHHHNIRSFREIGEPTWIVSSQGSTVRHAESNEILHERTMSPARVQEICERGRDLGVTLLAYGREGAYVERATPWTALYAAKAGWKPEVRDFRSLPPENFVKILWSDEPGRIGQLARELRPEVGDRYQMVVTEPELLEFLAPLATKAAGAAILANHLDITPNHTMAFGDGNNDIEILRWAGLSVAMAHGRQSAHRAAQHVSPPGPPETAFARAVDLALRISTSPR